jgi:hypothetical protein
MEYLAWDGSRWKARWAGNKFAIAPVGKWPEAVITDQIEFLS